MGDLKAETRVSFGAVLYEIATGQKAKTISQLAHPHNCALYDVGHRDGECDLDYCATCSTIGRS
jgi:hypothetical protein